MCPLLHSSLLFHHNLLAYSIYHLDYTSLTCDKAIFPNNQTMQFLIESIFWNTQLVIPVTWIFFTITNLGSMLLQTIKDNKLMQKWIYGVKFKFHFNQNIEWHCM